MASISIAGRPIGPEHEPYIVCELSGNHNGSLDRALQLLERLPEDRFLAHGVNREVPRPPV